MEESKGNINIGGDVGPGAAVGNHATVNATNIAGRDIILNAPRPAPPSMPKLIVGRSTESKKLERFLTENKAEHITVLSGPSGVGKTTLAASVVNRLFYHFPDGCLWADMAEYRKEPLALLKRFIKQLGQNVDGLDKPADANVLLKDRLSNLRVMLVLDNVEQLDELKYFTDLVNRSQSSVLIITSRDDIPGQISSECLYLDPLREKDGLSLFQKLSGLPPKQHLQAFQKIIRFCHGIPGLICPIASRIRIDGVTGLERWELSAGSDLFEMSLSDSTFVFRSLYKDLPMETKRVLRTANILAPIKLKLSMIRPLFPELSEGGLKVKMEELVNLRFLREIEPSVYEPDFLLKSNTSQLAEHDDEYDQLYLSFHDYYIVLITDRFNSEDSKITDGEVKDASTFFAKAIADERWDIVQNYVKVPRGPHSNQFSVTGTGDGLYYGFESEPFPKIEFSINGPKLIKFSAPGAIGESILISNVQMYFVNLNGCKCKNVLISDSVIGNLELNGASIENFLCSNSILSNIQFKGAIVENFQISESKVLGLNLKEASVENLELSNSIGSDWIMSNGHFNYVSLSNSQVFEARLVNTQWSYFDNETGVFSTPDNFKFPTMRLYESEIKHLSDCISAVIQYHTQSTQPQREALLYEAERIEQLAKRANEQLDEDDEEFLIICLRKIGRIAPDVLDKAIVSLGRAAQRIVAKAKDRTPKEQLTNLIDQLSTNIHSRTQSTSEERDALLRQVEQIRGLADDMNEQLDDEGDQTILVHHLRKIGQVSPDILGNVLENSGPAIRRFLEKARGEEAG